MKISNSKKELAAVIHENGGWPHNAEWAAQCKSDNTVSFYFGLMPQINKGDTAWCGDYLGGEFDIDVDAVLPNWHQTVLSRDEYFHLYPAAETAPEPMEVVVENKTTYHLTVTDKPTIEHLAADYRNAKDYADRKQQEADAAKADADAKLAELVAAGKAHGLVFSVADTGPELVITDWRDLRVGDRIWVGDSGRGRNCPEGEYDVAAIDSRDSDQPLGLAWPGGLAGVTWPQIHKRGWRFIRRPAKGGADA